MPSHFPKISSDPGCSYCYGTGYKYLKKQKDWRLCEYCAREHNTDLSMFEGTNLLEDRSLYGCTTVTTAAMIPPLTLPTIKSTPDCLICHG